MFSSQLDRVKVTEEIFVKLRNCIASNPSIKDWQHVHQFERDAIKVLLQQNPSESLQSQACALVDKMQDLSGVKLTSEFESLQSQACALVDKMQDLSGVKLTSEFDSYRLQSADAPSSSSTGKTPGDGMVTLSCNERVFYFSNHSTKNIGTFIFYSWCLRKL